LVSQKETFLYSEVPADYSSLIGGRRQGFVWSSSGMGQYEFSLTGVNRHDGVLLACTEKHIGELPGSASAIEPETGASITEIEGTLAAPIVTRTPVSGWELDVGAGNLDDLGEVYAQQTPIRYLLQTEMMDFRVRCGKTIYGVELGTDCIDGLLVGVSSRYEYGQPMKVRSWTPMIVGNNIASMIVYGVEFRVLVYAKDVAPFSIEYMKVFFKLTDRRGQYYGYQDLSFESRRPVGYGEGRSS